MVNVQTDLNNLKTKVDNLDVETAAIDLKKIRDVVSEEIVKKKVYHKLNTKVNNLEKKILTCLI